ncbi:MAG: UbiA family prenyltransferase [Belnapia sp.]|nr:UbiA family prenyltransferase [Belnapia sp.]
MSLAGTASKPFGPKPHGQTPPGSGTSGSGPSSSGPLGPGTDARPLVVDLDGTLVRSDTLIEAFFWTMGHSPLDGLAALAALRDGKAALKARIAAIARLDVASLPLNPEVLEFIQAERARGRPIYLASAADRRFVDELVEKLGLFDGSFASDGGINLAGDAKAAALVAAFGEGGFDYIGNDAVDLAIWEKAHGVLLADAPANLQRKVLARWPTARVLSRRQAGPRSYLKAIRLHQWAKNLLLLVPAIGAHHWGLADLRTCVMAFISFSLCASAVYVTNDLIDLPRDRAHPTKRRRPFAAGTIPLVHGLVMIPGLLFGALLAGLGVGLPFLAVLLVYGIGTLAYSLVLKRQVLLDVVTLAGLYGLRLYAGAVAAGVGLSAWLGSFALFLFTCLALVKRCAELIDRAAVGEASAPGRGYRVTDLPVLMAMAAASGYTAILVLALYADSPAVRALYTSPNRLYLICVVLLYWVSRVLLLTQRNEMHDDPVIFAATDRLSQACAVACGLIVLASM